MAAVRWEATLPLLRSGFGENSENNKVEFGSSPEKQVCAHEAELVAATEGMGLSLKQP